MAGRKGETVGFGTFEIDPNTGELRQDGVKVKLQDQSFAVLELLLERPGELVTREEFRERIWGAETYVDFDQGLNKAIKNIRAALGDSAEQPVYIETLPKRGYRFIAPLKSYQRQVETAPPPNVPAVPRRRTWPKHVALIAGMLAAASALLFFLIRRSPKPERVLELKQLTTNSPENLIAYSVVSPDGKYLLFGDLIGIHLRVISTEETHTFKRPAGISDQDSWYPTAWFPDQTHFLAVSQTLTSQGVVPTSWVVSLLGGEKTKLRDKASAEAVSPDGSRIAFVGGEPPGKEIWITGAAGEDPTMVAHAEESTTYSHLKWSPDGRRLFDSQNHLGHGGQPTSFSLESLNLSSGKAVPVIKDWNTSGNFAILVDGRLVGIHGKPRRAGVEEEDDLWQVQLNLRTGESEGAARRLTDWSGHALTNLSASSDGKTFVIQKMIRQVHTYLGVLTETGRPQALRRMTLDDSNEFPWAWTPDSKAVIFTSNRTGSYRLFKQAINEQFAEPINTGPGEIGEARISPDKRSIVYAVTTANARGWRVMRVDLSGGPPHLIEELAQTQGFDICCPSAPATRCWIFEHQGAQIIFRDFDPMSGPGHEVFKLPQQPTGWGVSSAGDIAICRDDKAAVRIFDLSGHLKREIDMAPWSSLGGLDWSADARAFYTSSIQTSGATILRVTSSGEIRPLWFLEGSLWAWAIAAPDGVHMAIFKNSTYSNVWRVENF